EGNGRQRYAGPRQAHDGIAEEVGKVAAEQGEDEADRHLRLLERDAREGDYPRHGSPDRGSGHEAEDDALRRESHGEAAHRRKQYQPVHGQVYDPRALRDRLSYGREDDGARRGEDSREAQEEYVAAHG